MKIIENNLSIDVSQGVSLKSMSQGRGTIRFDSLKVPDMSHKARMSVLPC